MPVGVPIPVELLLFSCLVLQEPVWVVVSDLAIEKSANSLRSLCRLKFLSFPVSLSLHMALGLRWQSNHVVRSFLSNVFEKQTMVFVSGGSGGADCDVDTSVSRGFWNRGVVLRWDTQWMCGGVGLGEQGGQRAWVRQWVVVLDGQYNGSIGWVS